MHQSGEQEPEDRSAAGVYGGDGLAGYAAEAPTKGFPRRLPP